MKTYRIVLDFFSSLLLTVVLVTVAMADNIGNTGIIWQQIDGLESAKITSVVIDPSNPATLYVGTWDDGVYKSIDGGLSWHPANTGMPFVSGTLCLAIDPLNPSTLYAANTEDRAL